MLLTPSQRKRQRKQDPLLNSPPPFSAVPGGVRANDVRRAAVNHHAMAAAEGNGVSGANGGEMGAAQGLGAQGQQDAGGSSAAAAGRSACEQPPAQLPQVTIPVEWSVLCMGQVQICRV
jgi:hypothetical protein